jgi:hypothetical protein
MTEGQVDYVCENLLSILKNKSDKPAKIKDKLNRP